MSIAAGTFVAVMRATGSGKSTLLHCAAGLDRLRSHHVLPEAARLAPNVMALPIASGIVLSTSVIGALVASLQTSRVAPSVALAEGQTRRRPIRRMRIGVGVVLVAGGAVLSAVLSQLDPAQADDATLFVMLAECIGVGTLAPVALERLAALLRRRSHGGVARIAVDNIETMSRSLSGALVPLVLAAAFAVVKIAVHTTTTRVTGAPSPPPTCGRTTRARWSTRRSLLLPP